MNPGLNWLNEHFAAVIYTLLGIVTFLSATPINMGFFKRRTKKLSYKLNNTPGKRLFMKFAVILGVIPVIQLIVTFCICLVIFFEVVKELYCLYKKELQEILTKLI